MARKDKAPRGLYQRKNGVWYCRFIGPDGRMIRKSLSPDKADAVLMLAELRRQASLQKAGIVPMAPERQIKTFAELRERYLAHYKARAVSESALSGFDGAYKRVVLANRFVYLSDMTLEKVEAWAVAANREGLTGQTINNYVCFIYGALKWAHENGHIPKNILANWVRVRNNEPRYRRDFQPAEVTRLFEAETDPEWRLRWLLYFYTGLRLSAGRMVCWEWIDWNERMLRLPLEHNKSRKVHAIPLSAVLYDALAAYRDRKGLDTAAGEIFPFASGSCVRKRLRRLCKKAAIDPAGICVHSIRHTFATMVYEGTGKNLKAVQEVLCHSNSATTMRYLHIINEEKRRAIDSLGFDIASKAVQE